MAPRATPAPAPTWSAPRPPRTAATGGAPAERAGGITSHAPGAYEVDHLISLELGGSNDIHNLWPEPYGGADNAHTKDGMENRLRTEVCGGQITLAQGQDEIVHWWMYE